MTTLPEQIAALPAEQAIGVLSTVLAKQGQPVDPFALRDTEPRLREALHDPDVRDLADPDPAATPATPATLARIALEHLAEHDEETKALVEHAIAIGPRAANRFDPGTLTVGALVLLAFRTEIELERDPGKGWSFRFHIKPLKESTVGKLLGQLLGTYLKP